MIKLIIFDLDGTLVDAYRAIEKSLNFTLKELGYRKVSYDAARRAVGLGDKNFIDRFVRPADTEKALSIYREHHARSLARYSRPISGAKKLLAVLRRKGYKLAIVTNRPERFTHILLDHLGIDKYFRLVLCGRSKADIKPNPNLILDAMDKLKVRKDQTLYVGDMVIDIRAGRRAGVRTIAVTTGSCSAAELKKARPFKVIPRVTGVLNFLD